jgi:hypothetical protein
MLPIMLEVTEADIAGGDIANETCPVALALRRVLAPGFVPAVSAVDVAFFGEDSLCADHAPLPPEAQDFIERFDAMEPVGPITFPIDVPEYMRASTEGR